MSEQKRKCIFTNKEANAKLNIGSDNHNWAKSVPCTKEIKEDIENRGLNELEIRLVEIFYQQELCKIRIEQYSDQMDEIRDLLNANSKNIAIRPDRETPKIHKGISEGIHPILSDKYTRKDRIKESEEQEIVEKEAVLKVSERDFNKLQGAIENPPEPNEKLKKAMESFKEKNEDEKVEKKVIKKKKSLWD